MRERHIPITIAIVLAGVAVYVVLYYRWVRKYPPGPVPLPLIGNLYHLTADTVHEYVATVGKDYGHCVTLFLPRPVVFFTDFSTVKESLVTNGDHFIGRSQLPPETYLHESPQTGVVMSDGEAWREQRRVSLKNMRDHGMGKNTMEAQVNRAIDEMLAHIASVNDGTTPIDMSLTVQLCFGNVIIETLHRLGRQHLGSSRSSVALDTASSHHWSKGLPIETILKFRHFVKEEIAKIDASFVRSQEPTSFAQSYLLEMETNPLLENLNAIVVDFWIGGVETLSATLSWTVLILTEYPEIQDSIIGGKFIPKDTLTLPQIHAVMRSERIFSNPDEFKPGRFLEEDGKTASKRHLEHSMAFGAGKRQCLGESLARMELFLVIGTLLLHYRFEKSEKIDHTPIFGSLVYPKPYKCRVVPM